MPKTPFWDQISRRCFWKTNVSPETSSQNSPRGAKGAQDEPRWLQVGSKPAQEGPKTAQDGPKTAQDGPKRLLHMQQHDWDLGRFFDRLSCLDLSSLRLPLQVVHVQVLSVMLQSCLRVVGCQIIVPSPKTAQDGTKTAQDGPKRLLHM